MIVPFLYDKYRIDGEGIVAAPIHYQSIRFVSHGNGMTRFESSWNGNGMTQLICYYGQWNFSMEGAWHVTFDLRWSDSGNIFLD